MMMDLIDWEAAMTMEQIAGSLHCCRRLSMWYLKHGNPDATVWTLSLVCARVPGLGFRLFCLLSTDSSMRTYVDAILMPNCGLAYETAELWTMPESEAQSGY